MTYRNEKAKKFVEPLAKELGAQIFMPLDLQTEGSLELAACHRHKID
jgi:enoyl-[acyl-carrier protein] reductase I